MSTFWNEYDDIQKLNVNLLFQILFFVVKTLTS